MHESFRFDLISPLDHRYYFANPALFEKLQSYLSENAAIRYYIAVELSLLETLAPHVGLAKREVQKARDAVLPAAGTPAAEKLHKEISEEIYREEEKTRHNIRAVVNVLKRRVPPAVSPYVHLGATSFDISDTAWSMRLRDVTLDVAIPELNSVQQELLRLAQAHMDVPQVGRTHGQYAVPITIGHLFAEYVSRLGRSIEEIKLRVQDLTGKLSGAVGAYNALSLIVPNPLATEAAHLARLGLKPAEYSSQIIAPEAQLRLLLEYNTAFGIIANLADDLRNLQRSEIGEVYEYFGDAQVGSSTMPQKRNPWNSEHVKSLYKAFAPRVITFYLDQISEHQRDLTNSASMRFVAEYLAGFCSAASRMSRVLAGLQIDRANIAANLARAGEELFAEALYILLSLEGEENGHEIVRDAMLRARKESRPLSSVLKENKTAWKSLEKRLKKIGLPAAEEFLRDASHYTGCAALRSARIVAAHKKALKK